MAEHALLSASSAHRWLNCTPSAVLERSFEDHVSSAAAEGTAAHALSEHKLREFLKMPTQKPVSAYDSPELEHFTDQYATFACELVSEAYTRSEDPWVLIEQKLDYSHYAPGGFGTSDLVIVSDGLLDILDLKYGRVRVAAEDNPQLKLYALGALAEFSYLYDIRSVRMTIFQPRLDSISTEERTVDELLAWAEAELKPKARLATQGAGEFRSGEHCRFCRVGPTCRARAERNLELAKMDFKAPALLTDDEVAEVLGQANELSKWATEVWAYAQTEALNNGKKWPGYKLIERKGNRKYTDEAKIAETVLATGDYTERQLYTQSLIGIGDMERLLGKKRFVELLGTLAPKSPSKPALVVESDKHKVWNPAEADFTCLD